MALSTKRPHKAPEAAYGEIGESRRRLLLSSLAGYHLLPSVRGDLLARLGRHQEARGEFERAASLTRNARERTLLLVELRPDQVQRATGPV